MYNHVVMQAGERLFSWLPFRRSETVPPQPFRLVDLEHINSTDAYYLSRSVRNNNGLAYVLVHPFHREGEDLELPFALRPEYEDERNEFIRNALSSNKPLIIFEEEESLSKLGERLGSDVGTAYFVPTLTGNATPSSIKNYAGYDKLFMSSRVSRDLNYRAWEYAVGPLVDAGVKRAEVGGKYMVLEESVGSGDPYFNNFKRMAKGKRSAKQLVDSGIFPSASPGQVINQLLLRDIDVTISGVASPTNVSEPTRFLSETA